MSFIYDKVYFIKLCRFSVSAGPLKRKAGWPYRPDPDGKNASDLRVPFDANASWSMKAGLETMIYRGRTYIL